MDATKLGNFGETSRGFAEALYLLLPWLSKFRLSALRQKSGGTWPDARVSTPEHSMGIVWFVDVSAPAINRDAGSNRLLEIVRDFQDHGYLTIFSSLDGSHINQETVDFLDGKLVEAGFITTRALFLAEGARFSFVWCSRLVGARFVRPLIKSNSLNCKFVYDTVDLHGKRIASYGQVLSSPIFRLLGTLILLQEIGMAKKFDATIAVSQGEQLLLEMKGVPTTLVGTVVEMRPNLVPWRERRGQIFVANFAHIPNVQGLTWYLKKVWPLLNIELKNQGLIIVGSNAPQFLLSYADKNIEFIGRVDILDPILQSARVSIAPIISGAGVNGKITEAMSQLVAVATTPLGAEGVGLTSGLNCLIGDTPQEFAHAVELLCTNEVLNSLVANNARDLASERFSRARLTEKLNQLRR